MSKWWERLLQNYDNRNVEKRGTDYRVQRMQNTRVIAGYSFVGDAKLIIVSIIIRMIISNSPINGRQYKKQHRKKEKKR